MSSVLQWMRSDRGLFSMFLLMMVIVLSCVLLLQVESGISPCPLCVLQRIAVFLAGIVAGVGIFLPSKLKKSKQILRMLLTGILFIGLLIAFRQVWLQHLPEGTVQACVPVSFWRFDHWPMQSFWSLMFQASGSCEQITFRWWGLSLAEWSLLWFMGMFMISALCVLRVWGFHMLTHKRVRA